MKMFFVSFFFFLLQSPCINLPCTNNGKCISLNETNSYICACKKIFTGKHCEIGKETAEKTTRSFGRNEIAVIAVASTDKASFVYSYVQTRLMGQYDGKRPRLCVKTAENCEKSY